MARTQGEIVACDCGLEAIFLLYPKTNRLAPIELKPATGGDIRPNLADLTYAVVTGLVEPGEKLYLNHYARCPHPRWRHAGVMGKLPAAEGTA